MSHSGCWRVVGKPEAKRLLAKNRHYTHDPIAGEIDYSSIVFIQNCPVAILQERSLLKRLEDSSAPYPTLQN